MSAFKRSESLVGVPAHIAIPQSKNTHAMKVATVAEACPWCDGTGIFARAWTTQGTEWVACKTCGGSGSSPKPLESRTSEEGDSWAIPS